MRFLKTFLISSLVPLAVIAFLYWRFHELTGTALGAGLLWAPVQMAMGGQAWSAALGGDNAAKLALVISLGWILVGISLLTLLVFIALSAVVGSNRVAMVAVFPALAFLTLLLATVLILGDIALVLGSIWAHAFGDQALMSFTNPGIYAAILGIAGLLAIAGLFSALARMFQTPAMGLLALKAEVPDHAAVLNFVGDVAERVGAKPPQNVVLELGMNFFATNARVRVLGEGKMLKGETLCLSLPSLRVLSPGELQAIIGHELGHFTGKDTRYTLAFAPALRGVFEAAAAARQTFFFKLPNPLGHFAAERLEYLGHLFAQNAAAASREREFAADEKGASASSPLDLASALIKMYVLAQVWRAQERHNVQRLLKGRVMRNLSLSFAERIDLDVQAQGMSELVQDALTYVTEHPTDTHPPTADRIRAMGVKLPDVASAKAMKQRLKPETPASTALGDLRFVEEQLTRVLQSAITDDIKAHLASQGLAFNEQEVNRSNRMANLFGQIFAHMVLADGEVKPEEIDAAETDGNEGLPDFDTDTFREILRDPSELTELDHLLDIANKLLDDDERKTLLGYLVHIANADNSLVEAENAVLEKVASTFFPNGVPEKTSKSSGAFAVFQGKVSE
jgi:Zn-dependent protease with chaperone function/uncharacterized tellurite resistance protein B-like protein